MNHDKIQRLLGSVIKNLFLLLVALIFMSLYITDMAAPKKTDNPLNLPAAPSKDQLAANLPKPWPPKMNETYPDLALVDSNGRNFNMSDMVGQVLLVEYIDITSPISQAQSGAANAGAYEGQEVDKVAYDFKTMLYKNTTPPMEWPHDNVVLLQILVFNANGAQTSVDDAAGWSEHFGFGDDDSVIVAVPQKDIRGTELNNMIGGYQLVDKNLNLRVDSSGPAPKHNLRMTLAPMVTKLTR